MSAKIPCFVQLDFLYCNFCFLEFSDYADFLVGLKVKLLKVEYIGTISVGAEATQSTQNNWGIIQKYNNENFTSSGTS